MNITFFADSVYFLQHFKLYHLNFSQCSIINYNHTNHKNEASNPMPHSRLSLVFSLPVILISRVCIPAPYSIVYIGFFPKILIVSLYFKKLSILSASHILSEGLTPISLFPIPLILSTNAFISYRSPWPS